MQIYANDAVGERVKVCVRTQNDLFVENCKIEMPYLSTGLHRLNGYEVDVINRLHLRNLRPLFDVNELLCKEKRETNK